MTTLLETCQWLLIMDNAKPWVLGLILKSCSKLILVYPDSSTLLAVSYVPYETPSLFPNVLMLSLILTFTNFFFWRCWVFVAACGFFLVVVSRGYSLVAVHGLFTVVDSLAVEHGPYGQWSSVLVACCLSGPVACGIFLEHWQADY